MLDHHNQGPDLLNLNMMYNLYLKDYFSLASELQCNVALKLFQREIKIPQKCNQTLGNGSQVWIRPGFLFLSTTFSESHRLVLNITISVNLSMHHCIGIVGT